MIAILLRRASGYREIGVSAIFILLFTCARGVHGFQGHHQRPIISHLARHSIVPISQSQKICTTSTLFQSQGVEDDFRLMDEEGPTSLSTRWRRRWLSRQSWSQAVRADKNQIAELGISFMLTYNFVSNINGSIFMSLAWYVTSVRVSPPLFLL